jgi:cell division septal protein FtsQ
MSEQTITGKGGVSPVRRPQAEIAGAHNALPHDDHTRGRQGNSAATKTGWRLFSEDVRRGRFFALVGLAFIAAAAVSFATSPEYIVTTVTVQGSKVLSVEQANAIAGVAGQNIFTIDPGEVQARLASRAALLKGVTVETLLPNHVIISVQERRPAVVWVLGDGTPLLASDDHMVVGNASTLEGFVTVFDRGPMTDSLKVGAPMPVQMRDAVDTAQQIYLTLPAATGLQLRQLEYAPDNGISAITAVGQRIEFGTGEKLEQKIKVVQAVIARATEENQTWSTLDVRSVDRPSLKR